MTSSILLASTILLIILFRWKPILFLCLRSFTIFINYRAALCLLVACTNIFSTTARPINKKLNLIKYYLDTMQNRALTLSGWVWNVWQWPVEWILKIVSVLAMITSLNIGRDISAFLHKSTSMIFSRIPRGWLLIDWTLADNIKDQYRNMLTWSGESLIHHPYKLSTENLSSFALWMFYLCGSSNFVQ